MSIKFQQMLPTELQQYSRTFPPQIVLTEIEQIVFNALPRARMIYCCGGWVRDKLIQVESDDLDMVVLAFEGGYPLFVAEFLKVDFKFLENRAMENISTALKHDLKTRDFKVNSLYFDPNSGYIIFHTIDVGFV